MSTMNTLIADLEAIPLADMTERDQLTFAAAIGHLRRLSDRVHMLEIGQHRTAEKIDELERENARMREALTFVVETRDCNHLTSSDTFRDYYAQSCPICKGRAALAGSGEK
jgi:hypothetical protein